MDFNKKIALIVEDEGANMALITKVVSQLGFNIKKAENGRVAFNEYKSVIPDVIFMDIMMPEVDGIQATKQIRKYEKLNSTNPVPIIAVTANVMKDNMQKCIEAGMDYYISKPFQIDEIKEVLSLFFDN